MRTTRLPWSRWALVALALAALARPAHAQEGAAERVVLEVRGEWEGADATARERAIDRAFASAVERGLRSLVSEDALAQHRAAIDKSVVRRARLFVSSYRVLSENAAGQRVQVVVSATVDLGKLRTALTEIKVPVSAAGAPRSESGTGPAALLLLKVTTPDGTSANFGRGGGETGAAGAALEREIQALGLRLRSAGDQAVAVSTGEGDPLLPLGDEAALDLARRVGAASVWIAGLEVRSDGPIRSTRLKGAIGRGKLRVLDAGGELVAESEAEGAGFDRSVDDAAAAAARDLSQRLTGAAAGKVTSRWSAAASSGPQILVRIRGAHTWASIGALIHRLGATSGVDAVHAREVVRGRIALGVETRMAPARIASALQQTRLPSGTLVVQARGERQVDVEIRGDTAVQGFEDSSDAVVE
jgi:hypothetical protein